MLGVLLIVISAQVLIRIEIRGECKEIKVWQINVI